MKSSLIALLLLMFLPGLISPALAESPVIRGGWSLGLPYQYETTAAGGELMVTGLDIEFMKLVSARAGFNPVFEEFSRTEVLEGVRDGGLDFGLAATPEASRHDWAWFSSSYRKESIAIFARKGEGKQFLGASPIESVKKLLSSGGRLAVIHGYYHGPEAADLLAKPEFKSQIVTVQNEAALVTALLSKDADAFLCDRLAAASVVWQADALNRLSVLPGNLYEADLCIIFSKKAVPEATLTAYNKAVQDMRASGELNKLTRHYLVPQLLLITMQTSWFRIFDIVGTIAFAISGVLIARREQYDIVGALVLAALPAVGGGVMRDLISAREPIGIVQSPSLLILVLLTVLGGMAFFTVHDLVFKTNIGLSNSRSSGKFRWASMRGALEVFDAIGLATFTIIGVMVAVEKRCEPLWLWGPLMAALTAAGGGVLRDILRSQSDIPTLKGSIYPEIAIFWGLVYSLIIIFFGPELNLSRVFLLTLAILVASFTTRIVVVTLGIRSLFLGLPSKNP